MKLLVDMNLTPDWVEVFKRQGWEALHWATVGDPRASDSTIMEWARVNGYVVFTHDLDLAAVLATTQAQGPSVVQIRTHDMMPQKLGKRFVQILLHYKSLLEAGALITIDENRSRVNILPFEWNPPKRRI